MNDDRKEAIRLLVAKEATNNKFADSIAIALSLLFVLMVIIFGLTYR